MAIESLKAGWILFAVSVVVLGIRLHCLTYRGVWEDEAFGYFAALGNAQLIQDANQLCSGTVQLDETAAALAPVGGVLRVLRRDSQYGPAYYVLLHTSMRLTGCRAVDLLKLWNVFFAVLTAVCLYALARRGLGRTGAALAVLLYAFSPWDISLGLQLKGYAFSSLCVVCSTWLVLRLTDPDQPPRRPWWLAYALILAIGILIHAFIVVLLPAHALFIALRGRWHWRRCVPWLLGASLAVALAAPWYVYALRDQLELMTYVRYIGGEYLGRSGLWPQLAHALRSLFLPLTLGIDPVAEKRLLWLLLGLGLVGTTGLLGVTPQARRIARLAGLVFFGSLALGIACYLLLRNNVFLWPRYYTMFLPLAWLTVAAALESVIDRGTALAARLLPRPGLAAVPLRLALFGAVAAMGSWQVSLLAAQPQDTVNDWRHVTRELKQHIHEGEVVVHAPASFAFLGFACYWDQKNIHTALPDFQAQHIAAVLRRTRYLAKERSVWFLLGWGYETQDAVLVQQLKPHGLYPVQSIRFPSLIAMQFAPDPMHSWNEPQD